MEELKIKRLRKQLQHIKRQSALGEITDAEYLRLKDMYEAALHELWIRLALN